MSRDFILEKLGRNLKSSTPGKRESNARERIQTAASGILPKQPKTPTALVARFIEKAKEAQATVTVCSGNQLPDAVSRWLREHNLPAEIRTGEDKRLSALQKPPKGGKGNVLTVKQGPSDGTDLTGVSHAECGISETGTLALLSGADNPTTLNFLPENHIVVVQRSDIAAHYEEIWPRLRKRFGKGKMPRTVNLITGPSRSADIEQTLLLGAHGPVRLHIIVIED